MNPAHPIKYFRVEVLPSAALKGCFNLEIWRLMKPKESLECGLGPVERWNIVGTLRCVDERNAACICSMLERPREPLQNNQEEELWAEKLLSLEKSPGPSVA
jgi:hypothetical protein